MHGAATSEVIDRCLISNFVNKTFFTGIDRGTLINNSVWKYRETKLLTRIKILIVSKRRIICLRITTVRYSFFSITFKKTLADGIKYCRKMRKNSIAFDPFINSIFPKKKEKKRERNIYITGIYSFEWERITESRDS